MAEAQNSNTQAPEERLVPVPDAENKLDGISLEELAKWAGKPDGHPEWSEKWFENDQRFSNIAGIVQALKDRGLVAGRRVLELGFGPGYSLDLLGDADHCIGFDIADAMIAKASARPSVAEGLANGRIELHKADLNDPAATGIPFLNEEADAPSTGDIDLIFHYNVQYFIDNIDLWQGRLKRLLRPGGWLAICTVNAAERVKAAKFLELTPGLFKQEDITAMVSRTGFQMREQIETNDGKGVTMYLAQAPE